MYQKRPEGRILWLGSRRGHSGFCASILFAEAQRLNGSRERGGGPSCRPVKPRKVDELGLAPLRAFDHYSKF